MRDPSGNDKTALNSTVAAQSSFVLSVVYPRDFGGGAAITYVGTYRVNITQTSPTLKPNVAVGQFEVGLTDSLTYQRTFPVSVKARGYSTNDNVTINIVQGIVSAPGFPTWSLADADGNFAFIWQSSASIPTGLYTVTLNGQNTPTKNPPDTQPFTIYPTNVTIPQISMPRSSLQRSETAEFLLSASYLSGIQVQTGSATLRLVEPDGTTFHTTQATYNSVRGAFQATYRVPLNSQKGSWVALIEPDSLNDGYGNRGPPESKVKVFTVDLASLSITISVSNATHTIGDIIAIYATITNPDGTSFGQGTVTASFSLSGRPVGTPSLLAYDLSQGRWVGSYAVEPDDPSGLWLIQVTASDPYDNAGQGSASSLVSVPPSQSPIMSLWFLSLLAAIVAGLVLGVLFLRRRRVFRRQLKVDFQAIGREAERVKNQEFFKSIQAQLKKKEGGSGGSGDG